MILNFGKYRGRSTEEVYRDDPVYVEWVLNTHSENPYFRAAQNAFKQHKLADREETQFTQATSLPWFEVLEVDPEAELSVIKKAYRKQSSLYHPDKVSALGVELQVVAHRKTQEINAAWDRAQKERGA